MAKAKLMPISELIGKNFYIPSYQRGFKWTTTQMKELLQDLYVFSKEWKNGDYYCLQPIIVKKIGDNETWEVVDGQQRLTAIWLIYTMFYLSRREQFQEDGELRSTFKLEYQKKDKFTELFKIIADYVDGTGEFRKIAKDLDKEKTRGVDALNLIENMEYITTKFRYMKEFPEDILRQICSHENDIDIIWYELENENAIQTFANINANKIDLTNAELLKALLLHARTSKDELQTMALQWDEIEKGLREPKFWNFLVSSRERNRSRRPEYSTHIDLLFEIWCAKKNLALYQNINDRHAIFREISKQFDLCVGEESRDEKAKEIWKEILKIYETICDWFENEELYHKIGLLLAVNADRPDNKFGNSHVIQNLYEYYDIHTRDEFNNELIRRITRDVYGANLDSLDGIKSSEIEVSLSEVGFDNKEKARRILLLYNVAVIVNTTNQHERFPFDLYNKDVWDLEHVNPQTSKELDGEEKKAFLQSHRRFLKDTESVEGNVENIKYINSIIAEIDACLDDPALGNFEKVSDILANYCEMGSNDNIQNLVLLDAETNRSYKNACFFEKRRCIIAKEKNNSKVGIDDLDEVKLKYIPIGTKCVFLKGFEKSREMIIWGKSDRAEYLQNIADNIAEFLGGIVDERQ